MNLFSKLAVGFLLVLAGASFGGCSLQTQQDSSIPWSKPASWEGQLPGMENNQH